MQESIVTSFIQSPGFWYRVVCCIESQALRYWQMVQGNEVSVRDLQMANNLVWLAEKAFPGKKIIVWAHNGHIAKGTQSLEAVTNSEGAGFYATFVPMGFTISQHFGKQAYAIGFSGSEGTYMDYTNSNIITVPQSPRTGIEEKIAESVHDYAFVDYRHAGNWFFQKQTARLSDFADYKGVWPDVFDGFFYIRNSFPVDRR